MNAELQSRQEEIVEEFSFYEDWMEKYEQLIEMGKELDALPDESRMDEHLIRGCQSRVWLLASKDENQSVRFHADSDAIITKGIIGLLIRVMNNETPEDVAKMDLYFITDIGLQEHLSPTRSNGLVSMVKRMKMEAVKQLMH